MDYLVFRLYGAMASWGDIAVGEIRDTRDYPSRSALLGLLAAALGITRQQAAEQQQLFASCRFAVKRCSSGAYLQDYHTAQVSPRQNKVVYYTRKDELERDALRLNTSLSKREYYADLDVQVAVSLTPESVYSLEQLQQALYTPAFPLYLGRKSCPLSALLEPMMITQVTGYRAAFAAYQCQPIIVSSSEAYYWQGTVADFDPALESCQVQTLMRHDQPISRTPWLFEGAARIEHCYLPGEVG